MCLCFCGHLRRNNKKKLQEGEFFSSPNDNTVKSQNFLDIVPLVISGAFETLTRVCPHHIDVVPKLEFM